MGTKKAAKKQDSSLLAQPGRSLRRTLGKAVVDFSMIRPGDRILLGLSGGKDSLSLLHLLAHLQRRAPLNFTFATLTVDLKIDDYDPGSLPAYLDSLGIENYYHTFPVVEHAKKALAGDNLCAYCSRMRRGIMYSVAREKGFNVLALGQHLDDLAESFMMSIFRNGKLHTMRAHYLIDDGDLRVIRPLAYTREAVLRDFAAENELPIVSSGCPACSAVYKAPQQRQKMKDLLQQEEAQNPYLFGNMLGAMKPLLRSSVPAEQDPPVADRSIVAQNVPSDLPAER